MRLWMISRVVPLILLGVLPPRAIAQETRPAFRIQLDPGHPWRPPFGLERVGQPLTVLVESRAKPDGSGHTLAAFENGKEVGRFPLHFSAATPFTARVALAASADEIAVLSDSNQGAKKVLAREAIHPPNLEVEAVPRPDTVINPVDLGTILVPNGWLLLGPGQAGVVDVAALARTNEIPDARVRVWFESTPSVQNAVSILLRKGRRADRHLRVPETSTARDRDVLHVSLSDGKGNDLWHKTIPTMVVHNAPHWPTFGATDTKLRYDAPISVRDPGTGTFSTIPYKDAWDPALHDVVVSLPNGARFVFWRGSSYIPFWAGRHNTGACYEWAEILSRFADATDCVEPLMDKTLRYGRVAIVESTPARVHVRWTYQSTDLKYKVWGDSAVEDYYFYPDGFGTRVLTLKSDPAFEYELSELIILTPPATYPFDVLPRTAVEALFLNGRRHAFAFPSLGANDTAPPRSGPPAIYRLRFHKDEALSAAYFNPNELQTPPVIFGPFYDRGEMVTPCYWGSHWPLARGNATGSAIDERVHITPCHNSVMSWAKARPTPLRTAELMSLDTLGRSKPMVERTWAWLIGMTDDPDERLIERANSFAKPPSLQIEGGRLASDSYVPERRAVRLEVDARTVTIRVRPDRPCVNPVFELIGAPASALSLSLAGRPIEPERFAWDGRTLWIDATIVGPTVLRLVFAGR